MPVTRRNFLIAALALVFPVLIFFLHAHTGTHIGDTDRYYHFAVSRMLAEQHSFHLETLPQAEDLGWKDYFPDKEFLFHVLTTLGYRVGGETGAEYACLLVAAGIGLTLFWFALSVLGPVEAFACALAAFGTHFFAIRMTFLRPHVLAIFLFVLLCAAIARRKPWLAGVAAAAFGLAYHAFYLPLGAGIFVLFLAQAERADSRTEFRKLAAAVLGGSVIGIVINPYFPSNIVLGVMHALIPFRIRGALLGAPFGNELYPLAGPGLLKFFYFPYLVVLGALAVGLFRDFATRFLMFIAGALVVASFLTARGGEPLVPVTGLLLPLILCRFRERRWIYPLALSQLAVLAFLSISEASFVPDGQLYDDVKTAVSTIPAGPGKVFNCEWSLSPFVFYQRPDLRFVDLLDPSYLYEVHPALYEGRVLFGQGKISDPRALTSGLFGANYVLCETPSIVAQLERDPAFTRLYPRHGESMRVALFGVQPAPLPQFVRTLKWRVLGADEAKSARTYVPRAAKLEEITLPEYSQALSLTNQKLPVASCVHVSAGKSELARLAGADYLGVGGGGAIRAWRNGKLIFAGGPEYPRARSVQALVPLSPPLKASDSIDALMCSAPSTGYWAASLSLWSKASVNDVCRRKAAAAGGFAFPEILALTTSQDTCFAPLAEPPVPPEMRP